MPKETAQHHRNAISRVTQKAFEEAKISPSDLSALAYTKGPGMGAPLQVVALFVRTVSQLWNVPIVAVNHCIGHIE